LPRLELRVVAAAITKITGLKTRHYKRKAPVSEGAATLACGLVERMLLSRAPWRIEVRVRRHSVRRPNKGKRDMGRLAG